MTIMRALVKQTLGHALADHARRRHRRGVRDADKKGGLHARDRRRVKTGTGY